MLHLSKILSISCLTFIDLKIMPGSEHKYVEVTGDLGVVVEKKLLKHKKERCEGLKCLTAFQTDRHLDQNRPVTS